MLNFFFSSRRRHTRFDCDWSSDVCSSDLSRLREERERLTHRDQRVRVGQQELGQALADIERREAELHRKQASLEADEIGRASCRERVEMSVVAVAIKKNIKGSKCNNLSDI